MATALSSDDLNLLRSPSGTHATKTYMSVVEPVSVATALINQTTFTNPISQLTVDTTSANWLTKVKKGMSVWIGTTAGARDVGVYLVRKTPTATILYISEISKGDFGSLALSTLQPLANNLFITVVEDFSLWTVYSRIAFSGSGTGTFYKDYDITYSAQTKVSGTPVALKLGSHRVGFVDSGTSLLTESFTATIDDLGSGVTVSTYAWSVGDGTITVGTSVSAGITATFPVGQRYVECTVTLSNGATVTGQRVVIAHNTTTNMPLKLRVQSDRRTRFGRRMVADLPGTDLDATDLPAGTMIIIWEESTWASDTIDSAITQFVGWVESASPSTAAGQGNTTVIQIASALEIMRRMGFVSQQLTAATTPANWTEVESTLCHTEYMLFYLLYWHSHLLRIFDFSPNGEFNSYVDQAFATDTGNLPDTLNQVASRLNLFVAQASDGRISVQRDPQLMTTSERNNLPEIMTATEGDLKAIPEIARILRPSVGLVQAYGRQYSGGAITPFVAYAPGASRGQGGAVETLEGQLVSSSSELNTRASNHYTKVNNPRARITLEFTRNYDVFDLADMGWLRTTLPAEYWPEGVAFNSRCIPLEVTVRYGDGGDKQVTVTVEAETSGINAPAQNIPVVIGNDSDIFDIPFPPMDPLTGLLDFAWDPFTFNLPTFGTEDTAYPSEEGQTTKTRRVVFAWGGGYIARLYPDDPSGAFEVIYSAGDRIGNLVIDPNSSIYTNPSSGTVTLFFADTSSTAPDGVYKIEDALSAVPTVSKVSGARRNVLRPARSRLNGYVAGEGWPPGQTGSPANYTIDGTVATTQNFDTPNGGQASIYVSGEIVSSDGYTYDPAYRTNDGWATYERYNSLELDGDLFIPDSAVYNGVDHGYWFTWVEDVFPNEDPIAGRWLDPAGTWSGSGSWNVDRYPAETGTWAVTSDGWATFDNAGGNIFAMPYAAIDAIDHNDFLLYAFRRAVTWASTSVAADSSTSGEPLRSAAGCYTILRVPYRKFGGGLNSDMNAMDFIIGTNRAVSGESTWRCSVNTTTKVVTKTNITPAPGGVVYLPGSENSIESYGGNPNVMAGWFEREDGQGGSRLFLTLGGGSSWSQPNSVAFVHGNFITWEDSNSFWVAGTDGSDNVGIKYTPDRGASAHDYTNKWNTEVYNGICQGVAVVRF